MLTITTSSPDPIETELEQDANALMDWLQGIGDGALRFGLTVAVSLLLYLIGRLVIRAVTRSIERGLPLSASARKALAQANVLPDPTSTQYALERERRRQRARTFGAVLRSFLAVLVAVMIVGAALSLVGIPLAPLLASAGVVGVALGFGAQTLVRDILSGMFMLLEDQYGVGDVVDLGEAQGTVEEFGLRTTRIRAYDGTVWYVPNGQIARVGNMTRLWSRALIEVRLAYDTDLHAARTALLEAVAEARAADEEVDAAILSEPEIPGVEGLDYDALIMRLLLQVTPGKQWAVMRAIRLQMRTTLARHGVRIALPRTAVYFGDRPSGPDRGHEDDAL